MRKLFSLVLPLLLMGEVALAYVPFNPGQVPAGNTEMNFVSQRGNERLPGSKQLKVNEMSRELPNSEMYVYVFDKSESIKAGFQFISGDASRKSSVIVQEYSMFENRGKERYGIAIRMIIHVNQSAKNLKGSIPWLTAQAERNKLKATISLQVIGVSGKPINDAYPLMPQELNFSTLVSLYHAVESIRGHIYDEADGVYYRPQFLGGELGTENADSNNTAMSSS